MRTLDPPRRTRWAVLFAAAWLAWLVAGAAQAQVQRADLRIDGMT